MKITKTQLVTIFQITAW